MPRAQHRETACIWAFALAGVVAFMLLTPVSYAASHTLTVTANHGSVAVTPEKPAYDDGETVRLIPRPDTGYCFMAWGGDARGGRLVLDLTMDGDKAVTADFGRWQPPIGIPVPEFGILDTHRMYEGQTYDFGSGPEPYKDAGNGPYTHYVDGTHPNATNSRNPYGTASQPRETLPDVLPAGSVVEVHGGPYAYANAGNKITIQGNGTADRPVFIRGAGKKPQFRRTINLIGQYMVIEGLSVYNADLVVRIPTGYGYSGALNHISIRSCDIEGGGTTDSEGGTGSVGADHIVIYNNHVHHFGDYAYAGENDRHGVGTGPYSHYIWVVDNHIHHNGGDSFQAGHGARHTVSHVYIGRNVMHDDGENAVDLKEVTDVIVSENTMYSYPLRNDSSDGTITVTHYGPSLGTQRAWFIANEMYDADVAANQVSSGPEDIYYIGNVIHDIRGRALIAWNHENVYFINNTLYNVGGGIDDTVNGAATAAIVNNIFGTLSSPSGNHITLERTDYRRNAVVSNNLFQDRMKTNTPCGNCLQANPLFVDADSHDFRLRAASPAIDEGTSSGVVQEVFDRFQELYGLDIRKDIEGKPRTGTWDIGAYEHAIRAVDDLSVSAVSQNSVTLVWTVPGLDRSPGEGRYDIRYADAPLTDASWDVATRVRGEPVLEASEDEESFTLTGLSPGTTYHIALKMEEKAGRISPLSNVLAATTATSGNHAPALQPIGDRSVLGNQELTLVVNAADVDPGDTLTYSATGIPAGAAFDPLTRTFTWAPGDDQSGVFPVTFQVSDDHVTVSETIEIAAGNRAPVLAVIGDKRVAERALLSFSVSAADPEGSPLAYSATGLPRGADFADQAFRWTPDGDQSGIYQVTFHVSDGLATDSETIAITVIPALNRAPVLAPIGR